MEWGEGRKSNRVAEEHNKRERERENARTEGGTQEWRRESRRKERKVEPTRNSNNGAAFSVEEGSCSF